MRRSASVAVVLAAVLIARAGEGHVGSIIYPVYEIPTSDIPDLHDGTLEDWDDIVPGPSLTHQDFGTGWANDYILDAGDIAFRTYLAWHLGTQRLHCAIELVDDVYFTRGAPLSSGNTTWLMLRDFCFSAKATSLVRMASGTVSSCRASERTAVGEREPLP